MHTAVMRRNRGGERGFTLVETLVAIAIITVALVGIFQLLGVTVLSNVDSRNRSIATHFAEQQLESVRNTPFSSLTSVSATSDSALDLLGNGATWERTVTAVGSAGVMKGITVTVRWKQQKSGQTLSLSTLVHRDGINSIRTL